MVCHVKTVTWAESVREWRTEEDIWAKEGGDNGGLEKITQSVICILNQIQFR